MAWKSGWAKRREITVSDTNIDSNLTHFPLLLTLGTSIGTGSDDVSSIFDELTSDANRKKIAVTKDDGTTEIYVEIEKWDDANEQAWLWVSKSDLVLSSTGTTTLYLYYDSTQSDNTTYVGDVGSRTEVWDGSYKAVWHLTESSGTTATDSTSNNEDATYDDTGYSNMPTAATGQIDGGQDFDGDHDNVITSNTMGMTLDGSQDMTIQFWHNADTYTAPDGNQTMLDFRGDRQIIIFSNNETAVRVNRSISSSWTSPIVSNTNLTATNWYLLSSVYDASSGWTMYQDGTSVDTGGSGSESIDSNTNASGFGANVDRASSDLNNHRSYDGKLDEIRVSQAVRSAAWNKADYHAMTDNLVSWGSEETSAVTTVQAFITG